MEISVDKRAEVHGDKDLKFTVAVRSLENHTHGELTRGNQEEIRTVLAQAADRVKAILQGPVPLAGPWLRKCGCPEPYPGARPSVPCGWPGPNPHEASR